MAIEKTKQNIDNEFFDHYLYYASEVMDLARVGKSEDCFTLSKKELDTLCAFTESPNTLIRDNRIMEYATAFGADKNDIEAIMNSEKDNYGARYPLHSAVTIQKYKKCPSAVERASDCVEYMVKKDPSKLGWAMEQFERISKDVVNNKGLLNDVNIEKMFEKAVNLIENNTDELKKDKMVAVSTIKMMQNINNIKVDINQINKKQMKPTYQKAAAIISGTYSDAKEIMDDVVKKFDRSLTNEKVAKRKKEIWHERVSRNDDEIVSGAVVADKIAHSKIEGTIIDTVTPELGKKINQNIQLIKKRKANSK